MKFFMLLPLLKLFIFTSFLLTLYSNTNQKRPHNNFILFQFVIEVASENQIHVEKIAKEVLLTLVFIIQFVRKRSSVIS